MRGSILAAGAAAGCFFALAPASAKTQAECKAEYARKMASGLPAEQSRASYVKACLSPERASADPKPKGQVADVGKDDDTSLAKKTENPIADLISVPFNNYSTFDYGRRGNQSP
jgi:hypothetical protein